MRVNPFTVTLLFLLLGSATARSRWKVNDVDENRKQKTNENFAMIFNSDAADDDNDDNESDKDRDSDIDSDPADTIDNIIHLVETDNENVNDSDDADDDDNDDGDGNNKLLKKVAKKEEEEEEEEMMVKKMKKEKKDEEEEEEEAEVAEEANGKNETDSKDNEESPETSNIDSLIDVLISIVKSSIPSSVNLPKLEKAFKMKTPLGNLAGLAAMSHGSLSGLKSVNRTGDATVERGENVDTFVLHLGWINLRGHSSFRVEFMSLGKTAKMTLAVSSVEAKIVIKQGHSSDSHGSVKSLEIVSIGDVELDVDIFKGMKWMDGIIEKIGGAIINLLKNVIAHSIEEPLRDALDEALRGHHIPLTIFAALF